MQTDNTTKQRTEAHLFDLDSATWSVGAMWWVVDKQRPDKYVLRLPAEEGTLIMSGFYKRHGQRVHYNGQEGWLSTSVYDRVQRKRKMPLERIGLSAREFYAEDDDLAKASKIARMLALRKLDAAAAHHIVLLTAFEENHDTLLEELGRLLEPMFGDARISISAQSTARRDFSSKPLPNAVKHVMEALELVVGFKAGKDAFTPVECDTRDLVHFYADDVEQLEALRAANQLLRTLVGRSEELLRQEIEKKLASDTMVLRIMQYTTNTVNPFKIADVELYC